MGKALDIRPPAQPLALVSGARTQFNGDTATLMVENGRSGSLWAQVTSILQSKNYVIAKRDDASQTLNTDWVEWNRLDEDQQYRGRYQISVKPQGYQQAVVVKLVNLEQAGKPVADPASLQRYSTAMLNVISEGLDASATSAQNAAQRSAGATFDVQSAADDTGLPMLVVRAPFNMVWQRLPGALEKVGMKVTDSTRSQGSMALTYKPLSDSSWQELGARDPQLASGDYKLQVGDLDNRSSLQFIDPKGHTLTPYSRPHLTSNQKGWSNPALLIYSDANVCVYTSSFKLPLCWPPSFTPVTYFCKLLGIRSVAASMHFE